MGGETIGGRYELEELVGRGGMSTVYRARDSLLERRVAVKILHQHYGDDQDYVERFRREARAAAQLSHPNIVTVIDRGEDEGRQYIVFEYIDGENLKEVVARRGRLPVREAIYLTICVARALGFAHAAGLVHRDVKPQNILLSGDEPKVTDFGIARSVDVQRGITQTGTVMGTSEYIAPEQASGRGADALSDVYSLGVVLFELLAGEVPYKGDNFISVAMKHVTEPVPSVVELRPDVPLRLDAAVRRSMAKHPAERFQSMDELVAELEACASELAAGPDSDRTVIQAAGAVRASAPRRVRARRGRAPLVVLALGLLAVAGAAVGFALTQDGGGSGDGGTTAPRVQLAAIVAYDPEGDGTENDSSVGAAADRNQATFWSTEGYNSVDFGNLKSGVGVVVDAGAAVELERLTLVTDTPGMEVEIKAGQSPRDFPDTVAEERQVAARTTFDLALPEARRYYLIWITRLSGRHGHVNEVVAE